MIIAEERDLRTQLLRCVEAETEVLVEQIAKAPNAGAMEHAVLEWRTRVGKVVMQTACQDVVERQEEAARGGLCCGAAMTLHSRREKTVLTLLGAVTVTRRYWRCPRCRRNVFPADAWLGWSEGFSYPLQEAVAWTCSGQTYREALGSLKKLAGIELSVLGAEQIVARWGKEELEVAPYAERVKHALVMQIDGAITPMKEGWKEAKLAACCDWDRTLEKALRHPQAVTYVADWKTAEEFRDLLWQEAVARGVSTAREVAVLGDGAPWIWDLVDHLFPYAVQILDWYHLTEHLWKAGRVVHGEGTDLTQALVEDWKTEVWEGRSEVVEEHLRELVSAGKDDAEHTLRKCADYLRTHQHRIRYAQFEAQGWPTGSGVVEGACGHVLGLRFKRKSTRWTKPGARAVLHLRLDRLNGRWEERCALARKVA